MDIGPGRYGPSLKIEPMHTTIRNTYIANPLHCIIMMGVSGSGKTVVGKKFAGKTGYRFIEGDDLHPQKNVDKMHSGIPLTDVDRMPWLDIIVQTIKDSLQSGENCVVACSALKLAYRDKLREAGPVVFFYLKGTFELMHKRMAKRKGHFMPQSLLKSQFDTLEEPTADEPGTYSIIIDGDEVEDVVENCLKQFNAIIRP